MLQYLVRLISKHDPDILEFQNDLVHLRAVSLFSLQSLLQDVANLESNIDEGSLFLCPENHPPMQFHGNLLQMKLATANFDTISFSDFHHVAKCLLCELRMLVSDTTSKYKDLLQYIGEDPEMSSDTFFKTLYMFGSAMESTAAEVSYFDY